MHPALSILLCRRTIVVIVVVQGIAGRVTQTFIVTIRITAALETVHYR